MRLAVFLLAFPVILVTGTTEYEVTVVSYPASSNLLHSCNEKVLSMEFQTLKVKSGTTYVRRSIPKALLDYIASSAVKLGADPNVHSCSEEAANAGHNTFMIREGECLASNVAVPGSCAGDNEDVVYSATNLLSPNPGLPVSEVSNLRVEMAIEISKIKLSVSFDEGSPLPNLYIYKLQFDGQTEVVSNGSAIPAELSSCFNLLFTLTPYLQDEKWGTSATYQFPDAGVPHPEVNASAVVYASEISNITLNWKNFVKADPCRSIVGYEMELSKSKRGDENKSLLLSTNETSLVLTCAETSDYSLLKISVVTVAGVKTSDSFEANPGYVVKSGQMKKYFDKALQACVFTYAPVYLYQRKTFCDSKGGQPFDRLQISQVENSTFYTWLPLNYNTSTETWQWEDGTVMSSTDPLWAPGYGGPPLCYPSGCLLTAGYFSFSSGNISTNGIHIPSFSSCFL